MKTRFFFATLLLMAFGTLKAQDTLNRAPQKMDTTEIVCPDEAEFSELMRELGVNLQQLSDSVDWEKFERDMEKAVYWYELFNEKCLEYGDLLGYVKLGHAYMEPEIQDYKKAFQYFKKSGFLNKNTR